MIAAQQLSSAQPGTCPALGFQGVGTGLWGQMGDTVMGKRNSSREEELELARQGEMQHCKINKIKGFKNSFVERT